MSEIRSCLSDAKVVYECANCGHLGIFKANKCARCGNVVADPHWSDDDLSGIKSGDGVVCRMAQDNGSELKLGSKEMKLEID